MAKSTETFNKKEKEKKRLKKQQEKKEKALDRKNSSDKGKSLDEMMAYVDENGNITSTPPDPDRKKKVINSEDIKIGIARQENVVQEITRNGKVTFFNESKGYGFIVDHQSNESVFVHVNQLIDEIKENDKVTFEIEMGPKGPNAVRVKRT